MDMEEIKSQLRTLNAAVFGDRDNPKGQPGILYDLSQLDHAVRDANETLRGLRADIRRGVWVILSPVLIAIVALVLKK